MNENKIKVKAIGYGEEYSMWYECANCKCSDILQTFKYCPNCGKEIDWSETTNE